MFLPQLHLQNHCPDSAGLGREDCGGDTIGFFFELFHINVKHIGKMHYLCAVKQKTKNDEDSNFKNTRTD
jgi:hypothetical protein